MELNELNEEWHRTGTGRTGSLGVHDRCLCICGCIGDGSDGNKA